MVSLINFIRAHKRDHCNLQFVNLSVKNISHIYGAALDALHLTILTSYLCMVPHSFLSQIIWWQVHSLFHHTLVLGGYTFVCVFWCLNHNMRNKGPRETRVKDPRQLRHNILNCSAVHLVQISIPKGRNFTEKWLSKIHQNTGVIWSAYCRIQTEYRNMQAVSLHIPVFNLNAGTCEPDKTCVLVYFTQCIVVKIWEKFLEHILRRATSQI